MTIISNSEQSYKICFSIIAKTILTVKLYSCGLYKYGYPANQTVNTVLY